MIPLFLAGLIYLLAFSFVDLKTHKLDNHWILVFFLVGAVVNASDGLNPLTLGLGMIIMGSFGYILWKFNTIGGADMKLLPAMVPFLPFLGFANMLVVIMKFIIIFGVLGFVYGIMIKIKNPKVKKVAFIPVITLVYIAIWIFRVY